MRPLNRIKKMTCKFCIYCGAEISPDAIFCSDCGKKQPEKAATLVEPQKADSDAVAAPVFIPSEPSPARKTKASGSFIARIIRNSILLFLALIMVISAFLPLTTFEFNYSYSDFDLEINLSAVDQVVVLFDSFKNLDNEELMETKLWEKATEIGEFIEDNYDDEDDELSELAEEKLSKFCLLLVRMNAQSEDFSTPVMYYVSSVFSLIYIVNAIALFVFALLNLLASFKLLGSAKESMYKWTVRALTLTPVLLIIAFFNISIALSKSAVPMMSDTAIETIVLSITAIISLLVLRIVFSKGEGKLCPVPRAIAATLAIIVIFLSFAPVFTASVYTTFSGSEKAKTADIKMNVSFFEAFHIDELTKAELEDKLENYTTEQKTNTLAAIFAQFNSIRKKDAEGASGGLINNSLIVTLFGMKTSSAVLKLIPLISLLYIGTIVGASLILWQNASYFANSQYSKRIVIAGKITSAVCATLALAASITLLVVIQSLDSYLPKGYDISISAGVIFLALFAFGSIFCPHKVAPRVKKNDEIVEAEQI